MIELKVGQKVYVVRSISHVENLIPEVTECFIHRIENGTSNYENEDELETCILRRCDDIDFLYTDSYGRIRSIRFAATSSENIIVANTTLRSRITCAKQAERLDI